MFIFSPIQFLEKFAAPFVLVFGGLPLVVTGTFVPGGAILSIGKQKSPERVIVAYAKSKPEFKLQASDSRGDFFGQAEKSFFGQPLPDVLLELDEVRPEREFSIPIESGGKRRKFTQTEVRISQQNTIRLNALELESPSLDPRVVDYFDKTIGRLYSLFDFLILLDDSGFELPDSCIYKIFLKYALQAKSEWEELQVVLQSGGGVSSLDPRLNTVTQRYGILTPIQQQFYKFNTPRYWPLAPNVDRLMEIHNELNTPLTLAALRQEHEHQIESAILFEFWRDLEQSSNEYVESVGGKKIAAKENKVDSDGNRVKNPYQLFTELEATYSKAAKFSNQPETLFAMAAIRHRTGHFFKMIGRFSLVEFREIVEAIEKPENRGKRLSEISDLYTRELKNELLVVVGPYYQLHKYRPLVDPIMTVNDWRSDHPDLENFIWRVCESPQSPAVGDGNPNPDPVSVPESFGYPPSDPTRIRVREPVPVGTRIWEPVIGDKFGGCWTSSGRQNNLDPNSDNLVPVSDSRDKVFIDIFRNPEDIFEKPKPRPKVYLRPRSGFEWWFPPRFKWLPPQSEIPSSPFKKEDTGLPINDNTEKGLSTSKNSEIKTKN